MAKTKILFVCLGNICRSPSAEAVMLKCLKDNGLMDSFVVDSAGTCAYHVGEHADARMMAHAQRRGIVLTSISRGVRPHSDFQNFDLIVAMDNSNYRNLQRLATTPHDEQKIVMMTDYCRKYDLTEVPDPYYGGEAGFELVLDLLDDACQGLLKHLLSVE